MRKFISLALCALLSAAAFAQSCFPPLIDAAFKNDYDTFSALVENGEDLSQSTPKGLNLQCSLAYFSDENFQKAFELLKSKDVINLYEPCSSDLSLLHFLGYSCSEKKLEYLSQQWRKNFKSKDQTEAFEARKHMEKFSKFFPVGMTQYAIYKFHTKQILDENLILISDNCSSYLYVNSKRKDVLFTPNMKNAGNFFFCLYTIAHAENPELTVDDLNVPELFEYSESFDQQLATVKYEYLPKLFKQNKMKASFKIYDDKEEILKQLNAALKSKDRYYLIVQTGKNRLAPFQWVCVNGPASGESFEEESFLNVSNPDARFSCVDFQTKDISQLITVKIK